MKGKFQMSTEIDSLLDQIEKVDVPPFLFTRIQQKVLEPIVQVPLKSVVVVAVVFGLLVLANVAVVKSNYTKSNRESWKEAYGLSTENQLYK